MSNLINSKTSRAHKNPSHYSTNTRTACAQHALHCCMPSSPLPSPPVSVCHSLCGRMADALKRIYAHNHIVISLSVVVMMVLLPPPCRRKRRRRRRCRVRRTCCIEHSKHRRRRRRCPGCSIFTLQHICLFSPHTQRRRKKLKRRRIAYAIEQCAVRRRAPHR